MSKFLKLVSKYNDLLNEQDQVPEGGTNENPQVQELPGQTSALPTTDGAVTPESETAIVTFLKTIPEIFDFKFNSNISPELKSKITKDLLEITDENLESNIKNIVDSITAKKVADEQEQEQKKELDPTLAQNQPKAPEDEE